VRIENEPSYVLHRRAFGETSVTLELFTHHHGRVGALARGARQISPKSGKDALNPGALYRCDLIGAGELMQLRRFEIVETAPTFSGEQGLALLYLNELLIALLERNDAHEALFSRYRDLIATFNQADLGPLLRGFERSLLDEMGYGLDFDNDASGDAICEELLYRIDANAGFFLSQAGALGVFSGAAILELGAGRFTKANSGATRSIMRVLISERLGGKTIKAWDMLRDLAKLRA
jgi:DNA repair protein RecO (recombination protein O)